MAIDASTRRVSSKYPHSVEISVVIPTKDRPEALNRLLSALVPQASFLKEIVVVDASSKSRIELEIPGIRVRRVEATEPNLPLQRWQGVCETTSEVIAFFDDDVIPSSRYLETIHEIFERDSGLEIGGMSGIIVSSPEAQPSLLTRLRRLMAGPGLRATLGALNHHVLNSPLLPAKAAIEDRVTLSGPSMAFRVDALRRAGPQDWLIDLYRRGLGRAEDIALSGCVRRQGYRLVVVRDISVVHIRENPGTSAAKTSVARGLADTWTRYLVFRFLKPRWNARDDMAFFRYCLVSVVLGGLLRLDIGYAAGGVRGLRRIALQELPFKAVGPDEQP